MKQSLLSGSYSLIQVDTSAFYLTSLRFNQFLMNKIRYKIAGYAAFVLLISFHAAVTAQTNIRGPFTTEEKINVLLKKMTLEEKVGQMNQYNGFWEITGPVPVY